MTWKHFRAWDHSADPKRDALIRLIEASGKTDKELHEQVGASRSTYSGYRKKKVRRPHSGIVETTAMYCGATGWDWVKGEFIIPKTANIISLGRRRSA